MIKYTRLICNNPQLKSIFKSCIMIIAVSFLAFVSIGNCILYLISIGY